MHFKKTKKFMQRLQCRHEEKLECLETLNSIINIMLMHYDYNFNYKEEAALPACIIRINRDNGVVLPEKVFNLMEQGLEMLAENAETEDIRANMKSAINKADFTGSAFLKSIIITEGILAIRQKECVDRLINKVAPYFGKDFVEKYYQFFIDRNKKEEKELDDYFRNKKDKPCRSQQTDIIEEALRDRTISSYYSENIGISILAKALLGASGNMQTWFLKDVYTFGNHLKNRDKYLLFKELETHNNISDKEIIEAQKYLLKKCLKKEKYNIRKQKKEEARLRGVTIYKERLLDECTEKDKKDCIETVFAISKLINNLFTFGFMVVENTRAIKMSGFLDIGRKMYQYKEIYTLINYYLKRVSYLSYDTLETLVVKEGLLALYGNRSINEFEDAVLPYFGSEYKELFKQRWDLEEKRLEDYLKNIPAGKALSPTARLLEKELLETASDYISQGMHDFQYDNTAKALQGLSAEALTKAINAITDKKKVTIYSRGAKLFLFDEIRALNTVDEKEREEMQKGLLGFIVQAKTVNEDR